jgi:CBS domain-containing protein
MPWQALDSRREALSLRIGQAGDVAALAAVAVQLDADIALLHEGGIRIDAIAGFVGDCNTRLFARLWQLLAPRELADNSCLLVMGSEGRGEQILKTDQDNALLLRDGLDPSGLEATAGRFNAALTDLGYPPCPGGIMVTNPLWRQPLAGFKDTLRDWVHGGEAEGPMRLAIFMDARAVAGDAGLLARALDHLDFVLDREDVFLARFAAAIDLFDQPAGWWHRLGPHRDEEALDLKKLGIFPIVHGVRALALQERLRASGTARRLELLVARRRIAPALARDALDALHYLMELRLTQQLRQKQAGGTPGNLVRPGELGTLERETLRAALRIVREFRGELHRRFRLDAL